VAGLIYSAIASLDGYIEDEEGKFNWAEPDAELHSFVNDLERSAGTHLYGRRMYDVMKYWETAGGADQPAHVQDFADIWRAVDKVVYSRTLDAVSTARTRLERSFDPEGVRQLKSAAERDLLIGGADLAAHAFAAALVDELRLFLAPVAVGRGKPALATGVRLQLELADERRFSGGFVYVRYRIEA
jgi:dihydrofolate reductase